MLEIFRKNHRLLSLRHSLKLTFTLFIVLLGLRSYADDAILVVGDSLSAAYNLPSEQGWVHLLSERLKTEQHNYQVINASISGATTSAGLSILPAALTKHQPTIVILGLGGNDGLQGKPLPHIRKQLQKLIELSQNADAKVLLLGIRIPPNLGSKYAEPFFAQYESLSETYETALVPFLLEGIATNSELMMRDGIHPNAEAQALVLDNVWQQLEPLL
jgi:acyl-CoA thioesterase-1